MQRRQFIMSLAGGVSLLAPFAGATVPSYPNAGGRLGLRLAEAPAAPAAESVHMFSWQGRAVRMNRSAYRLVAGSSITDGSSDLLGFPAFDAVAMADGTLLVAPTQGGIKRVHADGRAEFVERPATPFASTTRLATDGTQFMAWDATNRSLRLPTGEWLSSDTTALQNVRQIVSLGQDRWAVTDSVGGQVLVLDGDTFTRHQARTVAGYTAHLGDIVASSSSELIVAVAPGADVRTIVLQEVA